MSAVRGDRAPLEDGEAAVAARPVEKYLGRDSSGIMLSWCLAIVIPEHRPPEATSNMELTSGEKVNENQDKRTFTSVLYLASVASFCAAQPAGDLCPRVAGGVHWCPLVSGTMGQ